MHSSDDNCLENNERADTRLQSAQSFRIPFQTLRVITALYIREMNTAYGRSNLGYLWSFIEPIGGIILLAISFSFIFRNPPLGDSFLLFYATGYLPFSMYVSLHSRIAAAIRQNKTLLFYPAVTFIDVFAARVAIITVSETVVMSTVFGTLIILGNSGAHVDLGWILIGIILNIILGTGIGFVNSVLFEIFSSWRNIWAILNRPIFFLSGVFFVFDSLPESAQLVLGWNPVAHIIAAVRMGIYPEYTAEFLSIPYVIFVCLIIWVLGLSLLRRYQRFIINN